jgi:hypothetical protein
MEILRFKLFEKEEYSDDIEEGFKYTELEVKEFIQDLMDNCDLEIKNFESILMDDNFKIVRSLSKATWCGFDIFLHKESTDVDFISREIGNSYLSFNNSLGELSIYSEFKNISPRFEKFFQRLNVNEDGYFLRILLLDKVNDFEKEELKRKIKENKCHEQIVNRIMGIRKVIRESRELSNPFKKQIFENKLGETTSIQGSFVSGYLFLPTNMSNLSKLVIKNNLPRIESIVEDYFDFKWIKKHELRLITEMDLKKSIEVNSGNNYNLQELKDRYEGIHGVIINFDYQGWFNSLVNEV